MTWLVLAYSALLIGPASQIYHRVDAWQNLASLGHAIERDAGARPMILLAPDETTRAFVDMFARPTVEWIPPPLSPDSLRGLQQRLREAPSSVVVLQLPGRGDNPSLRRLAERWGLSSRTPAHAAADAPPPWAAAEGLRIAERYALPNGRRYLLLEMQGPEQH